tara:strand:+ start:135 stop:794 length:660 start_codon:yes stop_codon:yes gene_type:complete
MIKKIIISYMNEIKKIVEEIIKYLEKNIKINEEKMILDLIKKNRLDKKSLNNLKPNLPPKYKSLMSGFSSISSKKIIPLKKSILDSYSKLNWKTDNGEYYEKNSNIGKDYFNGNMNAELIGPNHGFFKSNKLKLGIFLLEENIFYRDHKHAAPELYLILTSGTNWRFGDKKWVEMESGSIIYNEPFKPHAIKVGKIPFISIWCWPYNVDQKCLIVDNLK